MIGSPRTRAVAALSTLVAALAACSADAPAASSPSSSPVPPGGRCLVRLHGKGGQGATTIVDGTGVTILAPTGNAPGWGGREWRYFPAARYNEARDIVAAAVADCDAIIVNGFSNGAAFAAKLYCQGESFDGRLLRVVIDDPVPDAAVLGCGPAPDVGVVLYWTGALAELAQPGWNCADADWTCEGGTTIGIEDYAGALGTAILDSAHDLHDWYADAPQLGDWGSEPEFPSPGSPGALRSLPNSDRPSKRPAARPAWMRGQRARRQNSVPAVPASGRETVGTRRDDLRRWARPGGENGCDDERH